MPLTNMKKRSIIFRIRDIKGQTYLPTEEGSAKGLKFFYSGNKSLGIDAFTLNENFHIEQFIGVVDSKCVLIYEGDVVEVVQEGEKYTGRIGFSGGAFWLYGKASFPILQTYSEEITVIGNIWTMPEFNKE